MSLRPVRPATIEEVPKPKGQRLRAGSVPCIASQARQDDISDDGTYTKRLAGKADVEGVPHATSDFSRCDRRRLYSSILLRP
jgi:hypothetical protein